MPHFRIDGPRRQLQWNINPEPQSRRTQKLLREIGKIGRHAFNRIMPRIDRPDDLIHCVGHGPGRRINAFHFAGRRGGLRFVQRRLAQHRDARQARPEIIMNILGNPRAFAFQRLLLPQDQQLPAVAQLRDPEHRTRHQQQARRQGRQPEPSRFPDMGRQHQRHGGLRRRPVAITVAGIHPETVFARRHVMITHGPVRLVIHPGAIQPLQHILEPDSLGGGET